MSIDRLTTMAFSLYTNKGAYALLLGAGISRSAHIPSAWDIENVLIERIAAIKGVRDQNDWHAWYEGEYKTKATYSSLLSGVVSTKTERVQLMRDFFEATDDDLGKGWKSPTKAHREIAKLVKLGYIRVIMTTNFDRLIEDALKDEGVTFQVVLDESDLDKITPLTHSTIPTIIKINGDYIDCRFRNTESELVDYPERLKLFLQRIFSDFGLITCGWSAKWDKGLVSMISSSSLSRYNSFFTYLKSIDEPPVNLAEDRNGETMAIKDADSLFTIITEQIESLSNIHINQKINQETIIDQVKRYLSSAEYDIKLADLLDELIDDAVNDVMARADYNQQMTPSLFSDYVRYHHKSVDRLIDISMIVCQWGKPYQIKQISSGLVKLCVKPLVNGQVTMGDTNYVHGLAGTYLFNSLGMACMYYSRYLELDELFGLIVPAQNYYDFYRHPLPYLVGISHWTREELNCLMEKHYYFPYSFLIKDTIRAHFNKIYSLDSEYDTAYYIWEHFKSLLFLYHKCYFLDFESIPTGDFLRYREEARFRQANSAYWSFFDIADKLKDEWEPLRQGLFDGSYIEYKRNYLKADKYYESNMRG